MSKLHQDLLHEWWNREYESLPSIIEILGETLGETAAQMAPVVIKRIRAVKNLPEA